MSGSDVFRSEVDWPATSRDERAHGQNEAEVIIALLPLRPAPASSHTSLVSSHRDLGTDWDVEAGPSRVSAVSAAEGGDIAVPLTERNHSSCDTYLDITRCSIGSINSISSSISDTESVKKHSLLVEAIHKRDVDAVKQLLREGAPLDKHGSFGYTPLHEAVAHWVYGHKWGTPSEKNLRADTIRIIQELSLNASKKSDVLDSLDNEGDSPLSLAIKSGDMEIIEPLVIAGANINCVNRTRGTALHEAADNKVNHVLKYFLRMGTIENSIDDNRYAAIHYAARSNSVESVRLLLEEFGESQLTWQTSRGWTVWHLVVSSDSVKVAQYLVNQEIYNSGINVVDIDGRTPLFLTIDARNVEMSALLLRNGAALSVEGEEKTAIEHITNKFANSSQILETNFDECIYEEKEKVLVDYGILVDKDGEGKSQINVIEELVRCGQSKLLKHPMIESLIYVKWTGSLPVFYVILATYVMFLGSLNIFVITALGNKEIYNGTSNATETETGAHEHSCAWHYWVLSALIYISVGVLLIQECVWTHLQGSQYFPSLKSCMSIRLKSLKSCRNMRFEPYVKLCGFLLACCVPLMLGCTASAPEPWQRHVTCAALLLAWLQAMLLLSRFPGWGYYVLMFERVSINILKIFATSACLVIGFSICFMVQFLSKPPFDGPVTAFIKTLAMMTSEYDYEDLFNEQHDAELRDSRTVVRLLFTVFVIFVAIVLMNFMIGVAVSDINELAAIGDVRRLEKQVELLSTLEGLGSTVLGKWWKRLSRIRYHREINRDLSVNDAFSTTYFTIKKWTVYPSKFKFDAFQQTLTLELQNAILDIAKNKKQVVNKLDALYDAVVEAPDSTNRRNENDSCPSVKTLKDRIASLEASDKEIVNANKQIIDGNREITDANRNLIRDLKKVNDRIKSIEDANAEIIQSIENLTQEMTSIFMGMKSSQQKYMNKIVSSKVVSRKRLKKKRIG